MEAIEYIRWSSAKQSRGSSLKRQTEAVANFIAEQGWQTIERIVDAGASGWSGANMLEGELANLHKRFLADGGHGVVLVVETLDRLSRFKPISVIRFFDSMLSTGVTIALADRNMIISRDSLDNQSEQLTELVADSDRARREGDVRSARSRGSWGAIREGLAVKAERYGIIRDIVRAKWDGREIGYDVVIESRGREFTLLVSNISDLAIGDDVEEETIIGTVYRKVHTSGTCPAWLTLSPCRRAFGINPQRAATLNLIFERYADGLSYRSIARELNLRGEPTWRGGKGWQTSALKAIIDSRSSMGEYQHQSRATGEIIGDPVPDYFPQVVSAEIFLRANDARHKIAMGGRGRRIENRILLAQVARCGGCGGKMRTNRKTDRRVGGRDRVYYQCANYDLRKGCEIKKMHYGNLIEDRVLDHILSLALDDKHFRQPDMMGAIAGQLADQKRVLGDVELRLSRLAAAIGAVDDPTPIFQQMNGLNKEKATLVAKIEGLNQELALARGTVDPEAHIKRVVDIRADLFAEDEDAQREARTTIAKALYDLLEAVTFEESGLVRVSVKQGLRSISIRPDGQVWDFDFVKKGHAIFTDDSGVAAYAKRIGADVERPSVEVPDFDIKAKLEQIEEGRETLRQINRERDWADAADIGASKG